MRQSKPDISKNPISHFEYLTNNVHTSLLDTLEKIFFMPKKRFMQIQLVWSENFEFPYSHPISERCNFRVMYKAANSSSFTNIVPE